jgi:hypothetical protein
MPELTDYSFGKLVVGGESLTADLVIHPDGTVERNWWRGEGHNVVPEDLTQLLAAGPDTLVIGTGANGLMSVSEALLKKCQAKGIEVRAMPTAEAVEVYNRIQRTDARVGACFHLTC